MNIFWWYKDFVDFFFVGGGGHQKNKTIFRGHFHAFYGLFSRSRYRMRYILGLLKFKTVFGALESPDIFFWGGGGGG